MATPVTPTPDPVGPLGSKTLGVPSEHRRPPTCPFSAMGLTNKAQVLGNESAGSCSGSWYSTRKAQLSAAYGKLLLD